MRSVSVVILAYEVAEKLSLSHVAVERALRLAGIRDYQIILVTSDRQDGTNDGTPAIADAIARENPGVLRNHGRYPNRAAAFIQGLAMATKDFVTWVPGDNVITEVSLLDIFSAIGKADLIIGYTVNSHIRPVMRQFLSWYLVKLCNFLFGLRVKYYSGICVFPRARLQAFPLTPDALGFMVQAVVRLLRSGATYIEVPQRIQPTTGSTVGNLKSMLSLSLVLWDLFWERRETS